jgi:hypothetical protein
MDSTIGRRKKWYPHQHPHRYLQIERRPRQHLQRTDAVKNNVRIEQAGIKVNRIRDTVKMAYPNRQALLIDDV